jgi:hypothetical protein
MARWTIKGGKLVDLDTAPTAEPEGVNAPSEPEQKRRRTKKEATQDGDNL